MMISLEIVSYTAIYPLVLKAILPMNTIFVPAYIIDEYLTFDPNK